MKLGAFGTVMYFAVMGISYNVPVKEAHIIFGIVGFVGLIILNVIIGEFL